MKNFCYELGKLLYERIDARDVYFATGVTSLNDLRSALGSLKLKDEGETRFRAVQLLEELESETDGKSLYMQVDDVNRNLKGILELLRKAKGLEVPVEEEATQK